jgi:hypothetical protein
VPFVLYTNKYCWYLQLNARFNCWYYQQFTCDFTTWISVDINFIGRRIKAEKVIEQALAKLNKKSGKRKSEDDAETVTMGVSEIENENENENENVNRINPKKEIKQLSHDDTECSQESNKRTPKNSSDIHLLSDLRGLTNADEKNMLYFAAAFYCSGGDSASQKFEKKYNSKGTNLYTDSARTLGVQNALATSSNSTTVMDFLRYEVRTYVRCHKD